MMKNVDNKERPIHYMVRILCHDYIKKRIMTYRAPQREGTPKGERVGLSHRKYHAALLCLTDMELIDIAGVAGVSNKLLRVWRTQETFKKVISEEEDNFISSLRVFFT